MDFEEISESSSTLGDDWVKDSAGSVASSVNTEVLKEISSSDGSPTQSEGDVNAKKWTRLLGVANRPNPLSDWDQLYNLSSQTILRNDCRQLAKRIGNVKSVPELESFMTLYCKKRNLDYSKESGWMHVLEKLNKFDFPQETLFNIFFAFTTKYLPREVQPGSQVFDLMRLLLQYHDPQLANHLDSIKCPPHTYAQDWIASLLASATDDKTCYGLWDTYIERGDPFLIFFLCLVLIINAKEQLLTTTKDTRDEALTLLASLPRALTVPDVNDFIELAIYYSNRTPQCLREDFHGVLFGSNLLNDFTERVIKTLICLSISVPEITRKEKSTAIESTSIIYFIIDCRSQESFKAGNVYGSFNLDAQLFVDAPEQFAIAISHLEDFKQQHNADEHICFLGYGDSEKDQFMNMVISRFLRDCKQHISYLEGGYKSLHSVLNESGRLRQINSHDPTLCVECTGGTDKKKSWNLVGMMKNAMLSKSSVVKDKVNELVSPSSEVAFEIRHVNSKDRHGKRYRNEPSVFSLEDEDSDGEPAIFVKKDKEKEKVALASIVAQADVLECFDCQEVGEGGVLIPGHIALTRTHMHVLHDVPKQVGMVTTEARHSLATVIKVTSKKKIPELLTFKFGYELSPGENNITATHRFLVAKAGECAKAVKTAIFSLRPLPEEDA